MIGWCGYRGGVNVVVAVLVVGALLAIGVPTHTADSFHVDPSAVIGFELSQPSSGFAAAANSDDTGFPEQDAGFSAYYQVPAPADSTGNATTSPRLDVIATAIALETPPAAEDPVRDGAGTVVDLGSNFAIVTLPLRPALDQRLPPTNVNVYFDDQGWVVAYLPAGHPAAAIWRYSSAHADNDDEYDSNADLANNLLVLAINATLTAAKADIPKVTYSMVGYYDWQNPDCDAYVLFSNTAKGRESNPVGFLVPSTIKDLHASGAVLITSHTEGGSASSAELRVDGEVEATAQAEKTILATTKFDLNRPDAVVSQHQMSIIVTEENMTAAGVVMLLYNKPGS